MQTAIYPHQAPLPGLNWALPPLSCPGSNLFLAALYAEPKLHPEGFRRLLAAMTYQAIMDSHNQAHQAEARAWLREYGGGVLMLVGINTQPKRWQRWVEEGCPWKGYPGVNHEDF